MNKKILGFTLAEVLVTLAVIGIIASMTVPGMIASHQKQTYVIGLKTFVAEIQEGLKKYSIDNGCTNDLGCTGLFDQSNVNDDVRSEAVLKGLLNVLGSAKDCSADGTDCNYDKPFEFLNGEQVDETEYNSWRKQKPTITLANGMFFQVYDYVGNCSTGLGKAPLNKVCMHLTVDINGKKGPNRWGRDIYNLFIANNTAIIGNGSRLSWTYTNDGNYWGNSADGSACKIDEKGSKCAGRIIEEGWKMNY